MGPSSGRPVDVSFCRPGVLDQRMWTWFLMTARLPWRPQIATPDNNPKRNPMCRGGGGGREGEVKEGSVERTWARHTRADYPMHSYRELPAR